MERRKFSLRRALLCAIGALLLVKLGVLAMGPLRTGAMTPAAHAQGKAAEAKPALATAPATNPDEIATSRPPKTPGPGELGREILQDVKRRQEELDRKEEELKRKETQLQTMQADLDKQIAELQAIQAKIDEQIELRDDLESKAIKKLAKTYAAMPPENAAALIQQIDSAIAIRILGAMKERSAGRILAVVPPELASKLSEGLVRKR